MAPVTRLPPGQPPRKAPKDAGELVREAQDKLRLALQVGSLRNDPLLPLFEYLGADLNARYQLSVESDEAVNRLSTEGVAKLLTAVPSEEQFERWIRQALADHARGWLRRLDKLNIAAVCGLMFVCGLIGFAAGWLNRPDMPVPLGMQRGTETCQDTTDGGKFCHAEIGWWIEPPPEKAAQAPAQPHAAAPGRKPE